MQDSVRAVAFIIKHATPVGFLPHPRKHDAIRLFRLDALMGQAFFLWPLVPRVSDAHTRDFLRLSIPLPLRQIRANGQHGLTTTLYCKVKQANFACCITHSSLVCQGA